MSALERMAQQHFPEIPMAKPKNRDGEKPNGHQVAVRFSADDLKKLDQLVSAACVNERGFTSPTGMWLAPSRSSVLINLVRDAGRSVDGSPASRQPRPDPRQVDLDEAIERSKLSAGVDAIEASAKKLDRASKNKAPRGAPKKRRAEKKKSHAGIPPDKNWRPAARKALAKLKRELTPKRKKQIAAAHKRFAAKKRKAGSR